MSSNNVDLLLVERGISRRIVKSVLFWRHKNSQSVLLLAPRTALDFINQISVEKSTKK